MELIPHFVSKTFGMVLYPSGRPVCYRLNNQVATFVSWKPEPDAWVVDAFSINWQDIMFYAFPPFSARQNQRGTSFGHTGAATVAYSAMVPCYAGSLGSSPSAYPT